MKALLFVYTPLIQPVAIFLPRSQHGVALIVNYDHRDQTVSPSALQDDATEGGVYAVANFVEALARFCRSKPPIPVLGLLALTMLRLNAFEGFYFLRLDFRLPSLQSMVYVSFPVPGVSTKLVPRIL